MAHIELRLFIRATPERVWQIVSDLTSQERWMEDIHELAVVGETQGGPGTVLNVTSKLFGQPVLHDVMQIITWSPPHEIGVVHRGQFSGSAVFRLETAPGGTLFIWVEDFQPPLGPLGELGFRLVVGPHLRRVWGRSMENVRRLAEAS